MRRLSLVLALLLAILAVLPAAPQSTRQVALLLVRDEVEPDLVEDACREKLTELRARVGASRKDLPILTYHLLDADEATQSYCAQQLGITVADIPFVGVARYRTSGTGFIPDKVLRRHNRVADYESACTDTLVEATRQQVSIPHVAILIVAGRKHERTANAQVRVKAIQLKNRKLAGVANLTLARMKKGGFPTSSLQALYTSLGQLGPLAGTFGLSEQTVPVAAVVAVDVTGNPLQVVYRLDRVDQASAEQASNSLASHWMTALKGQVASTPPPPRPVPGKKPTPARRPVPGKKPTPVAVVTPRPAQTPSEPRLHKITLRAPNGAYLSAEEGGGPGRSLVCNRPIPGEWERFQLVDHTGGELRGGHRVTIQTASGYFFTAEKGGDAPVTVNRKDQGPWEVFVIYRAGSDPTGVIRRGDGVVFKTEKGRYWTALDGGGGGIEANGKVPAVWEVFTIDFR